MELDELYLKGLYLIKGNLFHDNRGDFLKVFNFDAFKEKGLESDFKESYFSISNKNVVRGMHFQTPPYDHAKLVYVTNGKIIDMLLDIRKDSITYGKAIKIIIDSKHGDVLYIPRGIAHGFMALEDNTIVNYMQTSVYSQENDSGILYDSFGYDWEGLDSLIISERDKSFPKLEDFDSPFRMNN